MFLCAFLSLNKKVQGQPLHVVKPNKPPQDFQLVLGSTIYVQCVCLIITAIPWFSFLNSPGELFLMNQFSETFFGIVKGFEKLLICIELYKNWAQNEFKKDNNRHSQ